MDRNEILEKIEAEFFSRKISEMKLEEIARLLNVSRPTIYYYFKSKEDLVIATMLYSNGKFRVEMENVMSENDLEHFVDWLLTFATETNNLCSIGYYKGYFLAGKTQIVMLKIYTDTTAKFYEFLSRFGICRTKMEMFSYVVNGYCKSHYLNSPCSNERKAEFVRQICDMLASPKDSHTHDPNHQ